MNSRYTIQNWNSSLAWYYDRERRGERNGKIVIFLLPPFHNLDWLMSIDYR
jgi:hypothetical protein